MKNSAKVVSSSASKPKLVEPEMDNKTELGVDNDKVNDTAELAAANLSALDQMVEEELEKGKGKIPAMGFDPREGKIFPYQDGLYGKEEDSELKVIKDAINKHDAAMNNKPVKNKRVNLKNMLMTDDDSASVTSSARRREIENIQERLKNGHVSLGQISR